MMLFSRCANVLLLVFCTQVFAVQRNLDRRQTTVPDNDSTFIPASTELTDELASQALSNLFARLESNESCTCTPQNAAVRKEWSDVSLAQRRAYIDAELCLQSKPTQDPTFAPGARTRYDDFVAVHINQTLSIHGTANFLVWHRRFTWAFEQAMRNECGYQGPLLYWNWGKYAYDPLNSPLFDGSNYSMSGNGEYVPHGCTEGLPTDLNCIPPGSGGGCVVTGPFANLTVNLGPVSPSLDVPGIINYTSSNDLAYNPRCLRRDISAWVSSNWTTDWQSYDLITNYQDILSFENRMQGNFTAGFYGVHTGGHFTIGGDPGGDLFASPGDPAFFLHHAQIDRTWWIWQNLNATARLYAFEGGTSTLDPTGSPPGKLTDPIIMGSLADTITNFDGMSTTTGPYCYYYE